MGEQQSLLSSQRRQKSRCEKKNSYSLSKALIILSSRCEERIVDNSISTAIPSYGMISVFSLCQKVNLSIRKWSDQEASIWSGSCIAGWQEPFTSTLQLYPYQVNTDDRPSVPGQPLKKRRGAEQWEGVRSPPTRTNQPASSTSPFPIPSLGSNASSPGPPDPIPMPSPKAWNHHHSPYDPIATPGSQSKYFLSPGKERRGEPRYLSTGHPNESSCPQMLPNERS